MVGKLILPFCIVILLSISFISAGLVVGDTNENNKIVELITNIPLNVSTGFQVFNRSDFWITNEGDLDNVADITYDMISAGDVNALGFTGTFNFLAGVVGAIAMDGDPWFLSGTDFQIAENLLLNRNLIGLGKESYFNTTLLIDGDMPGSTGGDATLVIRSELNRDACINLTESNSFGFSFCYDGSGTNRFVIKNWLDGTEYFTIDRKSGNISFLNDTFFTNVVVENLTSTGNITANNFFGNISANFVQIALGGGSPTINQLQEYLDNTGSSGFFLGGDLSDGGAGTLDISAGSGFIRTTNDKNAELQSFKWDAVSGMAVTDDTTQYVYVDDDGVISLSQDEFLERPDLIQIGVVVKESGIIQHAFKLGVRLEDSIGEAGRLLRRVLGISRNNRLGGLILGQSGDANLDVTMTAGQLEWGRTSYLISSFDTSGEDTFATYSASGEENPIASQWNNTHYDNSGTLTEMTNNRWANHFVYLEPDDHIVFVFGREQFVTEAQAENEGVPSTSLPTRITETSILIGRFTFKKSSNTATVSTNFPAGQFNSAGVTDHGNLAGLTDNDHPQYILNFTDGGYVGFFERIGSLVNRVKSFFVQDIDFNGTVNDVFWNASLADDVAEYNLYLGGVDGTESLATIYEFEGDMNVTGNLTVGAGINVNEFLKDFDGGAFVKNNTADWILNFTKIFATDWTNVTITESQISDLVHTSNQTIQDLSLNQTEADERYLQKSVGGRFTEHSETIEGTSFWVQEFVS